MTQKLYGLKHDLNFKNIFSRKGNLILFLSDAFQEKVDDFWYADKEYKKENKNLRYGISDIIIETKKERILIEMQNKDLKNLESRITMYFSNHYSSQDPGKNYENVKPLKVLLVLNYPYGMSKILKQYQMLEESMKEKFGDLFSIKIWNIKKSLTEKNTIDYQYARLFNLSEYEIKKSRQILKEVKKDPKFEKIVTQIEQYNMDLKTYQKLKEAEMLEMTFEEATAMIKLDAERRGKKLGLSQGKKLGISQGKKLGLSQGQKQAKLETARNLLELGIDINVIMKATNLTEKQIRQFQ